uniref:Longitudinals lacking protein, isoforms A/B/D/L n=1 Tax=Cacopsylla melanoneura TaxID=428564 RepID=A0A8D8YL85_9HEMI
MLSNSMLMHQGAAAPVLDEPPDSLTLEQFAQLRKSVPADRSEAAMFSHFYLGANATRRAPATRKRRPRAGMGTSNGPITCTKCGSQYKTRKSLRAHIRIQCGKEPNFHCPLCEKKTYQKIHIEVHMSRVHKIGGWRYNEPIHND